MPASLVKGPKSIRLKADVTLYSQYLGRGIPSQPLHLRAGTEVTYEVWDESADYEMFHHYRHTVSVYRNVPGHGNVRFSMGRQTWKLRKPFDPATYYSRAVERCVTGVWYTSGSPHSYTADDGFGNLVGLPGPLQVVQPNQWVSCKQALDCVVGWVYTVPVGGTPWVPSRLQDEALFPSNP